MSISANEDRELRKTENMEEPDSMTIEFLRARLLSERSVSKTARERAHELANRVAELEEQLKFVSLQREKAEKATSDILLVLKKHEIGVVSEEFDSSSEQEENSHDFEARNGSLTMGEASTNLKSRNNEVEAYSSSEIGSSPSTGRSLSWKSTRDSQHSVEKKKYLDPVRRRASFSSNGSSLRRTGKSCRRIRRRDVRSVEELQNDGTEKTTHSKGSSNGSDGEAVASPETSGYANGKNPPEETVSVKSNGTQKVNGHYFGVLEKDKDMESALLHQAQLIGRYEEEEKAQREWEERFRENNSGTQDSCDPGIYSDVTEERYETKSPELPGAAATLDSDNQEVKQQAADASVSEPPQNSKGSTPAADDEKGSLRDDKHSTGIAAPESSASEFSFPKTEKRLEDFSGRAANEASRHRSRQYMSTEQVPEKTFQPFAGKSVLSGASSSFDLAVVPPETSTSLGSVLEALQRAKLSLNEKLSSSHQVAERTSGSVIQPPNPYTNTMNGFQIPFATPGLFRLPTDYQFEPTAGVNPGIGLQPIFANFTEQYVEPRSDVSRDLFHIAPSRSLTPEIRSTAAPPHRFLSQPRLGGGDPSPSTSTNHLDPHAPRPQELYPFFPYSNNSSNKEEISRTSLNSEKGLPPFMRLSPYDGHPGPSMYR
ncbi:hypothetical protein SASPL_122222 [Salvia splendens]|uniref:Uncharacterized protein n=1 Tax=Salvia splendens TaxID=180675 RepID=A0A8X8XJL8_SALSN|nr:uncharacterized protein LOC121745033 [Salvia splendens]KAG6414848.1 hypothetical protein SASPL_122222 [Salvia splendens]